MTGDELRRARQGLGDLWALGGPLTLDEMARVLRLGGRDPAANLRDYERAKTPISGPLSLAVDLLLKGALDRPEWLR